MNDNTVVGTVARPWCRTGLQEVWTGGVQNCLARSALQPVSYRLVGGDGRQLLPEQVRMCVVGWMRDDIRRMVLPEGVRMVDAGGKEVEPKRALEGKDPSMWWTLFAQVR